MEDLCNKSDFAHHKRLMELSQTDLDGESEVLKLSAVSTQAIETNKLLAA